MTEAKKKNKVDTSKEEVSSPEVPVKKEKVIKLTDKQKDKILTELFEDGITTIEIDIIPGKKSVTLKNLITENQLHLDTFLSKLEGTTAQVLHKYTMELLKAAIVSVNTEGVKQKFTKPEQIEDFLKKLPPIAVDKLGKAQHGFEKQIRVALEYEKVDEYFFEDPSI
jgi:hypothetical protein